MTELKFAIDVVTRCIIPDINAKTNPIIITVRTSGIREIRANGTLTVIK